MESCTIIRVTHFIFMDDKEFFYSLYKETALAFQSEVKKSSEEFIATFPASDPMRVETLRFMSQGGKRLRTVLARVVTRFYGVEEAYATSALDTFHKFLLCHDDIIDRDSMRWGQPTVHTALEQLVKSVDRSHIGNSLATISGDLIATMSFRYVLDSQLTDSTKVSLMKLICRAMDEVAWGWYDQFLMDYHPLDSETLSETRIKDSIVWVTGKYTISFPLRFGFVVAEVSMPPELEQIADLMGVLFQTGDDLIGVFGDTEKSGKSNYGDIVQGKKTLPIWFTYQRASGTEKSRLVELVGKKDISVDEVDEVKEIIRSSGAYEYTQRYMTDLCQEVLLKLETADISDQLRRFLKGFTLYLVERES